MKTRVFTVLMGILLLFGSCQTFIDIPFFPQLAVAAEERVQY